MQDTDFEDEIGNGKRQETAITPEVHSRYVQELAERIRGAVVDGGGLAAVAKRTGIPQRTLSNLTKGQDAKGAQLLAIADATSVSVEWLISGRGAKAQADAVAENGAVIEIKRYSSEHSHNATVMSGYALLPRYNVEVSAGEGVLSTSEQIVEFLAFSKDWLKDTFHRGPDQLMLVQVRGDSMEPTLRDRDLVIVDIATRSITNGAIHVLAVGEELLVKRLERRLDGSVVVHSDNPRYQPETVRGPDLEDLRLVGQVLWAGGPPRSTSSLRGL
jgi:phage repressor protein C with HTH and peptisase S24 domain